MLRTPSLSSCSSLKFSGEGPQLWGQVQVIPLVQWEILKPWSICSWLDDPSVESQQPHNLRVLYLSMGQKKGLYWIPVSGENCRFHTNVMNCWVYVCINVSLFGPVAQGHFKDSFKTERKRKALQVGEGGAAITLLLRLSGPCWIPTASHAHRLQCAREKKTFSL